MAKVAPEPSARDKRLRVNSMSLRDFRAFPGPDEIVINLNTQHKQGCNLLLYGENGAGKSSLFEAFRGLFARRPDGNFFKREKNVFSGQPDAGAQVSVGFTDGKGPAIWTIASHPGRVGGDPRVVQTSLRAAMLDYRALLDTNYGQGKKQPNLFDIAMELLLADWALAGGETCQSVGATGTGSGVGLISTVTGGSAATDDKFDCANGSGVTDPIIAGSYTVAIDAFSAAGSVASSPPNRNSSPFFCYHASALFASESLTSRMAAL